uniref:RUN domain-containing protein n=1 Tax=Salmo trutta TaxID=8032 RepID=A0A673XXS3_SALTR
MGCIYTGLCSSLVALFLWQQVTHIAAVMAHCSISPNRYGSLSKLDLSNSFVGEGYKAERWLLHSLQVHLLSAQLRPLLKHQGHTSKYYNVEAFLLSEPYVTAMFQCLEAVEQNNPRLLALVNTVKVTHAPIPDMLFSLSTLMCSPYMEGLLKSQSLGVLPGAGGGWRSGEGQGPPRGELNHRLTTSQCSLPHRDGGLTPNMVVPSIALTEPASPCPAHSDALDSGEGDYDDGPEYLAIGNLGQRGNRRDSQNSTPGGEPGGGESDGETQVQSPGRSSLASVPPPTPRRSSFSEGQREPGRLGSRGHIRSMSDTGINSKHRHGEHVCVSRLCTQRFS